MHLRKSRVIRKIKEGKTAFSFKLNLCDPRVAEIAAMSGIDCLWIDMEHVPTDYVEMIDLMSKGKIRTEGMISHRFDLSDVPYVLDMIDKRKEKTFKVLIDVND